MKEIGIESLAYYLKQASKREQPKPIFFLGAGASVSGKIPLAAQIEKLIREKYEDNPDILMLAETDNTYSKLMGCLHPIQRNELLDDLIASAKINVTHIYLAQLIKNNLVDYVLTTNFDNLMLRALALFDIFPPVHDLTSISDFTTTTIKDRSVVYLHGRHNGTWLLNTDEEMTKVKAIVPRIFDTIKNKRPWIFLGYSGNDPIFEHIKNLGRFDNGLYWVGHDDYLPSEEVQKFLNRPNTNTHFIKGYDADAFMLKLNHALGLPQPDILDKPFSSLKNMLSNIVDIDDNDHFRGAKVRLEIARKNIDYSIQFFEYMGDIRVNKKGQLIDKLKKQIIDLIISEQYDENEISIIVSLAKKYADEGINKLLGELFFYVGNKQASLLEKCDEINKENLLNKTVESYNKSIMYMPYSSPAFYNCGISLSELADLKTGMEAEILHQQAIEKYHQAINLNPNNDEVFNNLGSTLIALAFQKEGTDAELLYEQGFEKYRQATKISPNKVSIFNNWGLSLTRLADLKIGMQAENLCIQAIEKFQQANVLDPNDDDVLNNWGSSLIRLADLKTGMEAENLYIQAIEKFRQANKLNPNDDDVLNNWGLSVSRLADLKTGTEAENLYTQAIEKHQQASVLDPNNDNILNNWGLAIAKLANLKTGTEAENLYIQAIEKFRQANKLDPNDDDVLNNWGLATSKLADLKTGMEAENLYIQAIEKHQQANKLDPNDDNILSNWGLAIAKLANLKTGTEAENLYVQAIEKFQQTSNNQKFSNNWGVILQKLAALKTGLEAENLYIQAIEKFQQANKLDPNNYKALSNWGGSLVRLAETKTGTEVEGFYQQASEKYQQLNKKAPNDYMTLEAEGYTLLMLAKYKKEKEAKEIYQEAYKKLEKVYKHNKLCYNLACCAAQLERTDDALKYLRISIENNEITVEKLLEDDEWTSYKNNDEFKTMTKKRNLDSNDKSEE